MTPEPKFNDIDRSANVQSEGDGTVSVVTPRERPIIIGDRKNFKYIRKKRARILKEIADIKADYASRPPAAPVMLTIGQVPLTLALKIKEYQLKVLSMCTGHGSCTLKGLLEIQQSLLCDKCRKSSLYGGDLQCPADLWPFLAVNILTGALAKD